MQRKEALKSASCRRGPWTRRSPGTPPAGGAMRRGGARRRSCRRPPASRRAGGRGIVPAPASAGGRLGCPANCCIFDDLGRLRPERVPCLAGRIPWVPCSGRATGRSLLWRRRAAGCTPGLVRGQAASRRSISSRFRALSVIPSWVSVARESSSGHPPWPTLRGASGSPDRRQAPGFRSKTQGQELFVEPMVEAVLRPGRSRRRPPPDRPPGSPRG